MGRPKSIIATDDVEVGFNLGRTPDELREAGIDISDVDIIPEHKFTSKLQEAKFMEEKVVIEIEGDDDPHAPVFIYSGHNGVTQYVERGKPQAIKRKYLYSMLMAKTVKFASAFGKDGSGNEFNRLSPSARTTHRVRLIRDDSPNGGMKWFQSVNASA